MKLQLPVRGYTRSGIEKTSLLLSILQGNLNKKIIFYFDSDESEMDEFKVRIGSFFYSLWTEQRDHSYILSESKNDKKIEYAQKFGSHGIFSSIKWYLDFYLIFSQVSKLELIDAPPQIDLVAPYSSSEDVPGSFVGVRMTDSIFRAKPWVADVEYEGHAALAWECHGTMRKFFLVDASAKRPKEFRNSADFPVRTFPVMVDDQELTLYEKPLTGQAT